MMFGSANASASADPVVTNFVNDEANWSRIQSFINGSSTYATTDEAVAAGTDGASIEDSFYLLRSQLGTVPTAEELVAWGMADIPLYGAAFSAGFAVGTGLDKWLHISSAIASALDSRTVDPWHVYQCDWKSGVCSTE